MSVPPIRGPSSRLCGTRRGGDLVSVGARLEGGRRGQGDALPRRRIAPDAGDELKQGGGPASR